MELIAFSEEVVWKALTLEEVVSWFHDHVCEALDRNVQPVSGGKLVQEK